MARGVPIKKFLEGYPIQNIMTANNIGQFLEVERVVLIDKPVPVLNRISTLLQETGGGLKGIRYAQESSVENTYPFYSLKDHTLTLNLNIALKKSVTVSELSIKFHHFGEDNFIILKKATVANSQQTIDLLSNIKRDVVVENTTHPASNRFSNMKTFSIPISNIKTITLEMEQKNAYPMRYVMALFTASPLIADDLDVWEKVRLLNIRYGWITDVSSKEIANILAYDHPNGITDEVLQNLSSNIIGFLPYRLLKEIPEFTPNATDVPELAPDNDLTNNFHLNTTQIDLDSRYNTPGGLITIDRTETNRFRYSIGVSNIALGYRRYSLESEFMSKTFETPITRSISIETVDVIPPGFPDGEWIKYYVSVDEGSSWRRIQPLNKSQSLFPGTTTLIPREIFVNSNDSQIIREKNPAGTNAYIDTNATIRGVKVKAELFRPDGEDFDTLSPEILSYRLRIGR